ncbi:hypothetical protein CAOG_02074 [Capsaspora owczarzaki ATCC 30864]|uniref:1-alkyl-2-acetylglycerophosphocholine esterase n=1 Tax=Capsaspora owczarzaki (strain ATCC 30864) TaxID=595528 RepID=A0A0D2VL51_CAPO3|nr:hypothetical protein CAOG_02074 [Capsaspora owczarzaki ATCC 30864]KJE90832.1 hypothetical protein CAOG_002074 [Capsaspora owczarzaki ATCC 30864]|eukprot:XP_004348824.1 hypothetical protein CAOG_02074 [Capsaspora owczarzaki ATCC 30864]
MRPIETAAVISTVVCALALVFTAAHDASPHPAHPPNHPFHGTADAPAMAMAGLRESSSSDAAAFSSSSASDALRDREYTFHLENAASPTPPVAYLILGAVPLLLALVHVAVERPRWQLAPLYFADILLLLAAAIPPVGVVSTSAIVLVIVFAAISAILGIMFAVTTFPIPSGPFDVATQSLDWPTQTTTVHLNAKLPQPTYPADVAGPPNVSAESTPFCVQVFYPMRLKESAARSGGADADLVKRSPASYLVHGGESARAYASFIGIPAAAHFLVSHLSLIKMNATENGPIARNAQFPVAIFCHGLGGSRTANAIICKELASFGFVVLCPEFHDGSASYTVLPDGREIRYQRPSRSDDEWLYSFRHRQLRHRTTQVLRLLAGLDELNDRGVGSITSFKGKLDPSRVLLIGHSFGAATAIYAAMQGDRRVRAVVAYDAWMFPIGPNVARHPIPNFPPILSIDTELFDESRKLMHVLLEQVRTAAPETTPTGLWLKVRDTGHQNFTEFPFFFPQVLRRMGKSGKMDPAAAMALINALTLRFIGRYFGSVGQFIPEIARARQAGTVLEQALVAADIIAVADAEHVTTIEITRQST